jgi:hypothetical protein
MAFSGVHAICCYAGGAAFSSSPSHPTVMPVIRRPVWSEAPATGVTSTNVAPQASGGASPLMRFYASADSWVSIGPSPNATSGIRFLVQAGVDYDVFVAAGDKFQWIAA